MKGRVRGVEVQAPVRPDGVVTMDGGGDRLLCGGKGREDRIEVELVLQDPVDAVGDGVLVAVRAIGHARQHARGVQRRAPPRQQERPGSCCPCSHPPTAA